jgi:nitrogen fixation/metabolism regulation signal transduction histidine kinase
MNEHRRRQLFMLFLLTAFSAGAGTCIACKWYAASLFLFAAAAITAFRLMSRQNRTIRDLCRFVNAVRFEEFNISFQHSVEKGLNREIGAKLEDALEILSEKTQQKEGRLNFYDLLLNRIDFAIMAVNADDHITWINKAAVSMVGRPGTLSDLRDFSPEIYDSVRQLTAGEIQTVTLSGEHGSKDIAVSMANACMRGDDIRIISLKNIRPIIDQTESEAWRKLVSILRHEIMNSMAPIISLAETFSSPDAEPESGILRKTMQTIYRRSKGLVEFVQNYKRLTDIPAPQARPFRVREMLDDITVLLKTQGIRFTYRVHPDDLVIKADNMQIEQVLINLIKNAWEASVHNEQPLVSVTAGLDNFQRPQVTVSDNGEGILPDVRKRIFIPFFTTRKNGSGIGLSLCKQIVNAHGGTIAVTSIPNRGSCFTIRL